MSTIMSTANNTFQKLSAEQRIEHCANLLCPEDVIVQTTSFGLQSAVLLHLVSVIKPDIPVIFVNTGYLFEETLSYANIMADYFDLNLIQAHPKMSPLELEMQYGKLWQAGTDELELFNTMTKLDPLKSVLAKLQPKVWLSGIRSQQSTTRSKLPFAVQRFDCIKVHPLLDWTDKMVHQYIEKHNLPRHPLDGKGYLSVGDKVTTKSLLEVNDPQQTRFMGLKRECGIHA